MADIKRVRYGIGSTDFVDVETLSDEMKFVQVMKLYKAYETLEDLNNALTEDAKKAIRLID